MRAAVFAVLSVAVLSGCAINPVSGRPEVTLISARQERELGAEEAKKVEASMGFVDDARLAGYVQQIGERVAKQSPEADVDYTFHVVDMAEPNAFALPGGYVYVSRGLLALMNSEDELAGVIGHEVGHVAARHAVQRVSRAAPIAIVTGLGAAVTGMVSPLLGDIVGGLGSVTNELLLAPYGREQEREADRVGVELAAKAAFDPTALASALRTLEREDALGNEGRSAEPSFFATHPPLPERVKSVRAFARDVPRAAGRPIAATPAAFLERLDGLPIGDNAADGVFEGAAFVHPDLDFVVVFPRGWKTANTREGVGARAPQGDAVVVVDDAGVGEDPMRELAAIDADAGSDLARRAERVDIGGRKAVHVTTPARTDTGPLALDITCIAHGGHIFRIVGAARPSSAEQMAPAFRGTARSFRAATAAERGRIHQTRLRLVRARGGETIAGLVARAHSTWTADMVAVANDLEPGVTLAGGRLLKVAVSEPYGRRR